MGWTVTPNYLGMRLPSWVFLFLFQMCALHTPIHWFTLPLQIFKELKMQCKHTLLNLILKTWHLKNPASVGTAEQYQCVGITYAAVICAVYWLVPEPLMGRPGSESPSYPQSLVSGSWGHLGATKAREFWNFHSLVLSFKRAKMKQILQVHFEDKLTPAVVLNTLGHLRLRRAQNEPMSLIASSYLYLQTLEFPKFLELMWFGQGQQ